MTRPPPESTRTAPLVPYTTLFRSLAGGHHEGQLEGFRLRKAPRRVAEHRPAQVDHAVLGLIVERRRRPAELHGGVRSEEHTSELQSLMRISYAAFCLKKNTTHPPSLLTT